MTNQNIGLSELIEQVKAELLAPVKDKDKGKKASFLFVESVELELQVIVKKEGKARVKVDVLTIGGAEGGGGVGQDKIQKVKVKLSPLFEKEEIKEYYKAFRPGDVLPSIKESLDALKGDEGLQDESVL